MRLTHATFRLIRPSSSSLAFLAVVVPVFVRSRDFKTSFQLAVPLLFGAMCTYILNDLDDLEKDKINHPDRPLPRGEVSPAFVATLYFICLALAFLTTRAFVAAKATAFLYYLGFVACISYRYVVEYLPAFKPLYVAVTTTIPLVILMTLYPAERAPLAITAFAVFLAMLGREMCKDIPDRRGDPSSVLHNFSETAVARAAFLIQFLAVAVLVYRSSSVAHVICLVCMFAALATAYAAWFRGNDTLSLALMKLVVFIGLYFLL